MLTISSMKSLIAPPFAHTPFSLYLTKASPFASKSIFCNPTTLQTLRFIHTKSEPPMASPKFPLFSVQNRSLQTKASNSSASGEVHVIVGPMFAGKTTTLLRRIQAETEKGRLARVRISCHLDKTLKGLCFSGRLSEAIGLLWRTGVKVEPGTYSLLLQECIFMKEYRKGRRIHAQMVIVGYVPNEYLENKLLILYAKSGNLVTAHVLFDKLQEKSLISWNSMITGLHCLTLSAVGKYREYGGLLYRSVAVIKSNKDTRFGLDSIVTHDGVKLPCCALANLSSFRQKFGSDAYDKLDVIGIDEAQFFEDLYDFCSEAADHDGKTVIVAGLDGDYLRRSFGSVLDIIPLADSVTKLTARCEFCGKRAFFTLRKTKETQTELIGGSDIYMPVCRQHYVSGHVVVEAARIVLGSQKSQCESCAV
ncbi:hypothetical protein Patl1_09699 [Pistacia atlantica]|uniref:Uncharacterized protein n=1 Tax=Pistacia atlantica TaxID=434234 RepID=A0ACC1A7Y4_9ROSI|nr:hypothetical protein Patl1_09699 [Pistacia atlantica]